MVNVKKLKDEMEKKGITVSDVADKLQLSPSTLYRKLQSGGERLTVGETAQIADILCLSTRKANDIFFWKLSHKNATDPSGGGEGGR